MRMFLFVYVYIQGVHLRKFPSCLFCDRLIFSKKKKEKGDEFFSRGTYECDKFNTVPLHRDNIPLKI